MADAAQPMHQDFTRWYATVSLSDDTARRDARWEGVLKVVADVDKKTVEALLRLAFGGRASPAPQAVQSIREALRSADETFEMSGNDRELQVLAGAALAVLMEDSDNSTGEIAALGVTTASLAGARKPDLPMNLSALGEHAIASRAERNRRRPELSSYFSGEPTKIEFDKAAEKVREQFDPEGVAQAFALAAENAKAGMRTLAQRQARALRAFDGFIRIQDEELQMLWWLIGQRSQVYDCAFDDVPVDARPLVFASELANCTGILPGPPSVKALLSRAGLTERRKLVITAAVNKPRADWLEQLVNVDLSPLSTPVHCAIKRQLETGPGEAWVPGWAASCGVDAKYALPSLTLGELFYRERLLLLFE